MTGNSWPARNHVQLARRAIQDRVSTVTNIPASFICSKTRFTLPSAWPARACAPPRPAAGCGERHKDCRGHSFVGNVGHGDAQFPISQSIKSKRSRPRRGSARRKRQIEAGASAAGCAAKCSLDLRATASSFSMISFSINWACAAWSAAYACVSCRFFRCQIANRRRMSVVQRALKLAHQFRRRAPAGDAAARRNRSASFPAKNSAGGVFLRVPAPA